MAGIFAISATLKLRDPDAFFESVRGYGMLPSFMERPFAWCVPVLELAAALGMAVERARPYAAAVLLALLAVFSAAIACNLRRGRTEMDCGCFSGLFTQRLTPWLLVRNAVLGSLVLTAWLPVDPRPVSVQERVEVALAAATAVALYLAVNQILANAPLLAGLRRRQD